MVSVHLPKSLKNYLENLCTLTSRPKSFYIKESLKYYLQDLADGAIAIDRKTVPDKTLVATKDVLKKSGLDE